MVFDFDTFHILAADVENTVHIRFEERGRIIMRDRLDFSLIQKERSFHQRLSVSGRAGVGNPCIFRKPGINIFQRGDRCGKRISVISMVEGIKKCTIFAYKRSFCRSGTGIDSKINIPFVGGKILDRDLMSVMTFLEFTELLLGSEERIQTLHFEIHLDMICQTFLQLNNRNIQIFIGIQCGSNSSKQVGILRSNRMFVIQLQCPDKCRSQLGEEMQRTAEECNMSADRLSACQTADCLIDYRLENRGCQVLLCGTVIDQRLDICLGKYTAACGNII